MKITDRKSKLLTKSNFNDEFTKIEKIHKVYTDNKKTPEIIYKTVELIHSRYKIGTCGEQKDKLIICESDESDDEYKNRESQLLATFNYNDGCTKTLKFYEDYKKTYVDSYCVIEFRYPYGTIDKDKSYDYKQIFDKIDESKFGD